MKIGFSQTAEHTMSGSVGADFPKRLSEAIHRHTACNYVCIPKEDGYVLKPSFRNMPYRNSFVPEVYIDISRNNGQTALHLKGQPVKYVRIFMWVWIAFLLVMEVIFLAASSEMDSLFPVFIPAVMVMFGYFLCAIATKATFHAVVKAIRKEFP